MGRLKYLLALVAVAAAVLAPASVQADSTVQLTRDVVRNLNLATPVGPVAPTKQLTVGVVLKNPNEAAETAFLNSIYNPSSSNYHQFLTPDQFDARFGVPASTVQAATAWLQNAGLTVTTINGATNYLLASGTAAQVGALFHTSFARFDANGRDFTANLTAPTVPASPPIATVLGLNDYNRFSTPHVAKPVPATKWTTAAPGTSAPVTGLLHPRDVWSLYDMPSTNLGNGRTMAIFGWGVTTPVLSDLRSFEAENRLPAVPIYTYYFGDTSTPDTNDGATVEWELDTQASTGMAPNVVNEKLYFAHHNTDADILAAFVGWVNDKNGPLQASASFGECENIPATAGVVGTDSLEQPGNQVLKQAVIEGRTLFSSTGDTGSSCPIVPENTNGEATQVYPALNYPSSSPWAVAVGGTDLTSDGGTPPSRLAETAWEFGGGGNSVVQPAGQYQQGVAPTNCSFDENGNPYAPGAGAGPVCRATPDVAAMSGDVFTGNGLMITDDSGVDQQGAGTSLSSPLWLGMWTRIHAASSKNLGFANYLLYKAGKGANYSRDFYDVTVGDNFPYPAKPGWDNATGWGVPDVAHLMQDLTGSLTPAYNTTPAPIAKFKTTSSGTLFSDPAGDDDFDPEGAGIGSAGANPQLDILAGKMLVDGSTLKTIITVKNLTTTVPVGGVENDYNFVWSYNGVQYFTQLAVEQNGTVEAYDGQLVHASLENRYQQLHVDTGTITPGPNGTIEVDVPLANVGAPASGSVLVFPSAASYVREGLLAGPLEPADSAGPDVSFVLP
jgi:pseudomonalisin